MPLLLKTLNGLSIILGEKKKIKVLPMAQRCHVLPPSFWLTTFHPRLSPCCSSDTSSLPLHLTAFALVLPAWNIRPQDIHLAHSLNILLRCYLLKEVFPDHPPSITSLRILQDFISQYLYMGIIYLTFHCLSAPTWM